VVEADSINTFKSRLDYNSELTGTGDLPVCSGVRIKVNDRGIPSPYSLLPTTVESQNQLYLIHTIRQTDTQRAE